MKYLYDRLFLIGLFGSIFLPHIALGGSSGSGSYSWVCFTCWDFWWEWFIALFIAAALTYAINNTGLLAGATGINTGTDGEGGKCVPEKIAEQTAKARLEAAKQKLKGLENARNKARAAEEKAKDAADKAERAKKAAGKKWTADAEFQGETYHREGYKDEEAGERAEKAKADAEKAKTDANKAQSEFDSMGGEGAWSKAKEAVEKAQKTYDDAAAALAKCLEEAKPEPKPEPEPKPSGPQGPSVAQPPPPEPTRTKTCEDGDTRNEKTETLEVPLIDLRNTKVMHSSMYHENEEILDFIDYLQNIKDGFFAGKKIKSVISSLSEGALDIGGFPDFLTYYDKMGDEVLKGVRGIAEIMKNKQKVGDWWLKYMTKTYTLTCTCKEVCKGNSWTKVCEFKLEQSTKVRRNDTKHIQVEDPSDVSDVIDRLFRRLEGRNKPNLRKMKRFQEKCK